MTPPLFFKDRKHAGRLLAAALQDYAGCGDLLVLGLPRGGVPVAFEVAQALKAPLDVILVRKLGVPEWEPLAMGAISCGGMRVLNREVIRRAGVTPAQIKAVTEHELGQLHRAELTYRGHTGAPDISGKTVLLIDDGAGTGSTLHAAVKVLRAQQPTALIIAIPTASADASELLRREVDDLVVLSVPEKFGSVSRWYLDFHPTSTAEVKSLIAEARKTSPPILETAHESCDGLSLPTPSNQPSVILESLFSYANPVCH